MTQLPLFPACRAVALLVDGQNTAASLAGACIRHALTLGRPGVQRVYGDARTLGPWHEAPGFRVVHAHAGKNVTDIVLTIEAMELAVSGAVDGFALASMDRDFIPLAQALRARGLPVLGLLGPTAPEALRKAFTQTVLLAPPVPTQQAPAPPAAQPPATTPPGLQDTARALLAQRLRPADFARQMGAAGHRIPQGSASWRAWLTRTIPGFTVTGTGQEAILSLTR